MRKHLIAPFLLLAACAAAQSIVPARTLPAVAPTAVCPAGSACGITIPGTQEGFTLRKQVGEVRVEFKVTDRKNRSVETLTPQDFRITDNGHSVEELTDFRRESDLPINIAILIDCSRSTQTELPAEKQIALDFLHSFLRPQDKALIAGFNNKLIATTGFTSDHAALQASLESISAGGLTAFNDAIYKLSEVFPMGERDSARNVLVVISDGIDTISLRTASDALNAALLHSLTIYTVSVMDKHAAYPSPELARLSSETAGESYYLTRNKDLQKTFQAIDQQLRTYFVATYRPQQRNGGFHRLAIEVSSPHLKAHTRAGYFASN